MGHERNRVSFWRLLGAAGPLALPAAAAAGLIGAAIEFGPEQHPEGVTYRVHLVFDDDRDQLLAVAGWDEVAPLVFATDGPALLQNNFVEGTQDLDDVPSPTDLGGDSWVVVGRVDRHNTDFSPDFLGGDGMASVIKGNAFAQLDDGSYFDEEPATAERPDANGRILIAQFSLPPGARFSYGATATYIPGGGEGYESLPFFVQHCPGDVDGSGAIDFADLLAVLAGWGPSDPCPPPVPADVNEDCVVDFDDLLVVLGGWGPCTLAAACAQ